MKLNLAKCSMILFFLFCFKAEAFNIGDEIVTGSIRINKGTGELVLKASKEIFRLGDGATSFRSDKKTDWKVILKDKRGNNLEHIFLILKDSTGNIFSDKNLNRNRIDKNPYSWADFVFKWSKDAYKVDLFFKGVRKATALIDKHK